MIKYYFKKHSKEIYSLTENTVIDLRHQIFKFYDFLLFYDISIKSQVIDLIGQDYGEFEVLLFSLYEKFKKVIDELRLNSLSTQTLEMLGNDIKVTNKMETINNLKKQAIDKYIENCNSVIMDVFLFLTDI